MEATYNFSALEIGDGVFFITEDGGVKYGKIKKLHYIKEKGKESVVYTVNSKSSDNKTAVILEYTAGNAFKSAKEALDYLTRQKLTAEWEDYEV